jgi:hypothetical protein
VCFLAAGKSVAQRTADFLTHKGFPSEEPACQNALPWRRSLTRSVAPRPFLSLIVTTQFAKAISGGFPGELDILPAQEARRGRGTTAASRYVSHGLSFSKTRCPRHAGTLTLRSPSAEFQGRYSGGAQASERSSESDGPADVAVATGVGSPRKPDSVRMPIVSNNPPFRVAESDCSPQYRCKSEVCKLSYFRRGSHTLSCGSIIRRRLRILSS